MYQETFAQHGGDLLQKLDQYIRDECLGVIHMVGISAGWCPGDDGPEPKAAGLPSDAVHALLQRYGDEFLAGRPRLREQLAARDFAGVSMTQWEAYLALHHGKPVYVYRFEKRAERHPDFDRVAAAKVAPGTLTMDQHSDLLRDSDIDRIEGVADRGALLLSVSESLHRVNKLTAAQRQTFRRLVSLPYRPLGQLFKGREALLRSIHDALNTPGSQGATISPAQAIHGAGGIGKTRAAVEYAWQQQERYDALLFVVAETPEKLDTQLADLAGVLQLAAEDAQEPERLQAVLRWLREQQRWLLIVDNVDSPAAQQAVARRVEELTNGDVLITTRRTDWPGNFVRLPVDLLTLEHSIDYLLDDSDGTRRRRSDDDPQATRDVAEAVGRLSLGLTQARSYVDAKKQTYAYYLERFRANDQAVRSWFDTSKCQYPRELAQAWQTSLETLSPQAQLLMRILTWFDAEPIPESLLEAMPDELRYALGDPRECLLELEGVSLVEMPTTTPPVFFVHRLIQEITRDGIADAEAGAEALRDALAWLDAGYQGEPQDVRTWGVLRPLQPHAVRISLAAADAGLPAGRLLNQTAQLVHAMADFPEAEPLMRRALEIDEASYGKDHPRVARDLNNLSQLLMDTNRLAEAEPLMRRALEIDEASYGNDHPKVAIRLNNLAHLLKYTNRLTEAEPLMRRVLEIDQASYGEDHPEVATDLNNLAALLQAINRLNEAEPLMRRALAIDEASYGRDHPKVARDLSNLAQLLKATNRLNEAEPLMRHALEIDEASYGEDHPNVAIRLNNLAGLLLATNRLNEAEPLMRRALEIDEVRYGKDHPTLAVILNNLAQALHQNNRLTEAEPLMRRVVEIFLQFGVTTGHAHPQLQAAFGNYAGLLSATGVCTPDIHARINALLSEYEISPPG